jgi:hypothetical protein
MRNRDFEDNGRNSEPDDFLPPNPEKLTAHDRADELLRQEEESRARWERAMSEKWERFRYEKRYSVEAAKLIASCRRAAKEQNEKLMLAVMTRLSFVLYKNCRGIFMERRDGRAEA